MTRSTGGAGTAHAAADAGSRSVSAGVATFGALQIDLRGHRVSLDGGEVDLTKSEYRLLAALVRRPGRAVRDRDLLTAMWGVDWQADTASLQVHVSRLRRKLGESGSRPRYIRTVAGFGYRFDPDPAAAVELALSPGDLAALEAAGETGPVAYALLDVERTIQWVSESVTALTGWQPDDLVGVCVYDLAPDDERPSWLAAREALDEGLSRTDTWSVRSPDGSFRAVRIAVRPLVGGDGHVSGFLGEWRPLQSAAGTGIGEPGAISLNRGTDASLLRLLSQGSDVLWVYDGDGVCRWVSPGVEGLLGLRPRDLVGTRTSLVHPDDRAEVLAGIEHAVRDGVDNVRRRVRLLAADGSPRWVDAAVTLERHGGTVVRQFAAVRDITAQVAAERAHEEAAANYRLLAENAADVVARLDADDRPVWVSPSLLRVLGHDPAAVVAGAPASLVHPDDLGTAAAGLAALRSGVASVVTHEIRLRHRNGTYTWWSGTARRIGDDPRTSEIVVALRDVDEHVRSRAAAREQQERRLAALDAMLDPYVLLEAVTAADGRVVDFEYTDANRAACAYLGLHREELVGARLLTLLPGHADSELFGAYVRTVATGEPLVLDDYTYPHDILGEPRRYDIRAVKVGNALSFTWRDVTDR